jgi:putative membrane protein
MQRTLIIALLLLLIVVVFALQNSAPIQIKLLFWEVHSSIAFIMSLVLFIGALLGVLFSLPSIFKKNDEIAKLKGKQEQKSEK